MVHKFDVHGLSDHQIHENRTFYGTNELPAPHVESFSEKLLENFQDPLIKILCLALGVTMVLAVFGYASFTEGIGIAMSVFLATVVSTYSEWKNEASFQTLQEKANQIQAMVYRNGQTLVRVDVASIVVGDVVLLQAGDRIPAGTSVGKPFCVDV